MASAPLFENEHVVVTKFGNEPIVLVARNPTRLALAELDDVWGAADRALAKLDRKRFGMIVDVRQTVGRNDEDFEKAFAPFRQRLSIGWCAMALLVASLPGKLQVQRYAREDGVRVSTFDDWDTALAWVRSALRTQS